MKECLVKLSEELGKISGEIAMMKANTLEMEHVSEKEKLRQKIKDKQFQALFYIEKIENLAKDAREKGMP